MTKAAFYLITDSHFVSKRSWTEGRPFTMRERGDQIALKASPEILDAFIDKILADEETDTVIFTGDNVNNGDIASHEDFRERLKRLADAGKNVYVTTATHDYCGMGDDENFFKACRYTETGTEPAPFMRKAELFDYYYDYGPKQAVSVHRESGSYSVKVGDCVRLVMINDNGNGRSHCGLFEDGVKWLGEQISEAKAAGEYVLLAVHHPVLPPWEVYRHMADFELYGGYRDLWKLMCEEGVRVVFTGHTHVQSIRKYTDGEGRWFVDVATIALVNAAGKMRRVTVENGVCDVVSVGIDSVPGLDTNGLSLYEYLFRLNLPGAAETLLKTAVTDYDKFLAMADGMLPVDKLKKHPALVKAACKKLLNMRLSTVAKFGKGYKDLTDEERRQAKEKKVADVMFGILRHIYPGNAPYTPDTVEYKSVIAAVRRADKLVHSFRIEKVESLIPPGSSLEEMARPFLYNDRTGDDDAITIELA